MTYTPYVEIQVEKTIFTAALVHCMLHRSNHKSDTTQFVGCHSEDGVGPYHFLSTRRQAPE